MNKTIARIVARMVNGLYKTEPKHWVFGSDYGNLYREGTKYLFEYMCQFHPEYKCTFVTRNSKTYLEIKSKGLPVVMNYSWSGIKTISKADSVFTTQATSDIFFAYKKKGRKHYYLNHGQSIKKQMKALGPSFYIEKRFEGLNSWQVFCKKLSLRLSHYFDVDTNMFDSEFISATSDFFIPFLKASYGENMLIKTLGMPRNDSLFHDEAMKHEKWIDEIDGKFIITYMPTHRKYGKGELSPIPFINHPEMLEWMRDNNVVLLMKQHPNMIKRMKQQVQSDVIKDITLLGLDSQVVIYHSDVLVSDYSSVWLDYLLLKRPLITYLYDDFENKDAGLNIDIKKDMPGHLCYNEEDLFNLLKDIKHNYHQMCPSIKDIQKFHCHIDGNSCERYYNEISKRYI